MTISRGYLGRFRPLAAASAFVLAALATLQAQPDPQKFGGRSLLATVVNQAGATQVDLAIDDFVVTEDGRERDIVDVRIADYPVAVLVDDGNASALPVIKRAVDRFITRIGARPIAAAVLSSGTTLVADFSDERPQVLSRVSRMTPGVKDAAVTLDTVARAAQVLRETGSPFSAIVVVAADSVDPAQPIRGELLPVIIESGAAVHVVAGRSSKQDGTATADTPDLLRILAEQSRGQYTAIFSQASYSVALDRLADRLAAEMLVEYLVPAGSKAGDVRIGVRRPGARVVGLGVSK